MNKIINLPHSPHSISTYYIEHIIYNMLFEETVSIMIIY